MRVPVLSKQSVLTRPSASSARVERTSTPSRDSRRAAASWETVATSGSPSGTAAGRPARTTGRLVGRAVRGRRRVLRQGGAPR